FACQRLLDVGIIGLVGELFRYRHAVAAVALGAETRLAGVELGEAFGDDRQIGPRHRLIEAHQDIASLDAVAVARAHFADDAAGRVLHLFYVGIHDQRALRDQRAGNFRRRRPTAQTDRKESHGDTADQNVTAN